MITFPHIGFLGRLGNQMFQYSALFSLCKKYNLEFTLSKVDCELYKCFALNAKILSYFNSAFSVPNDLSPDIIKSGHTITIENADQTNKLFSTAFDLNFYNQNHDNKSILGFFQNYKYFFDFEDSLRDEFRFKKKYDKIANNYLSTNFNQSEIISLHIRRTDYINSDLLNNLDINYYEKALLYFDSSLPVLVFSDDPNWCQEQSIFADDRFFIMKSNDTYIDLCLMSKCDYHIIANSTYSWWGSWLAKSKKTISPNQWFKPHYEFLDSDGLRLPYWISI